MAITTWCTCQLPGSLSEDQGARYCSACGKFWDSKTTPAARISESLRTAAIKHGGKISFFLLQAAQRIDKVATR